MIRSLFPLGRLMATPGALAALERTETLPQDLIARHGRLDPGELDRADQQRNVDAIIQGARILSAYLLLDGTRIWVITEADRVLTTILLPDEY